MVTQGVPAEQVLQDTQRELEAARLALAAATVAGRADRSLARDSLEKAQDLGAELFRMSDQLKLARLDADESYSRVLDLEMEVRLEQARLAELQLQNVRLGEHLRQALTLHHEDGARWQAEVARVLGAHQQDTAVWQAEVERLQLLHQDEKARLHSELDRLRAGAEETALTLAAHHADEVRWQAQLDRMRAEADETARTLADAHQDDKVRWQSELDQMRADADETARTLGKAHQDDKARWQSQLTRMRAEANETVRTLDDAHQRDKARRQLELDRIRTEAAEISRTLAEVLSSRSWRMTSGIRRMVERMHGRRWEEPKLPSAGTGTPGRVPRGIADPYGDD